MGEERCGRPDESLAFVITLGTTPGGPCAGWQLGSSRRLTQEVDHHELAVMIPPTLEKPVLGFPPHRNRGVTVEKPLPIDAIQQGGSVFLDPWIGLEMISGMDDAAEKNCAVDGGQLAFPDAFAGAPMEEVIKEAVMMGLVFGQPGEGSFDLGFESVPRCVIAGVANAQYGQAEAGRCDASDRAGIGLPVRQFSVHDQTRLRMRPLNEKPRGTSLQIGQQRNVLGGRSKRVQRVSVFSAGKLGTTRRPQKRGAAQPAQRAQGFAAGLEDDAMGGHASEHGWGQVDLVKRATRAWHEPDGTVAICEPRINANKRE